MATNKKPRIFLVCQKDLNSKTCNKNIKFRSDDIIYILTEEEQLKLPEYLLDFFNSQEKQLPLDGDKIVEYFKKTYKNNKQVCYFIGNSIKDIYNKIGSDIMLLSGGIAYNDTFGVTKIPIEKPTQSEIVDMENSFANIAEALGAATQDCSLEKSDAKKQKSSYESKNQKKQEEKNETNQTQKGAENRKENTESEEKKEETYPVRLEKDTEEKVEISIAEKCMQAKATVVACLLERFQEHVAVYTKRKMERETCFHFLELLLKAKNLDDFTFSWKCQEPESNISLSLNYFLDLKKEALYWFDVSKIFYDGDLWNY